MLDLNATTERPTEGQSQGRIISETLVSPYFGRSLLVK